MKIVRTLLVLLALAAGLHAQDTARDILNQGVTVFKAGNYSVAAELFKAAIALDPSFTNARLYLGTAYLQQFVPDVETPDNRAFAAAAITQFRTVLDADPKNLLAAESLASVYYNLKDFTSAEEWNRQVLTIDPTNTAALYTLGVISWTGFIGPDRQARANEHMKPEDPPPLKDSGEREALKARHWQSLTEGIEYEKKALAIDPEYANAMAYLNLLIRYRADLDDSPEQAQADVKEADGWVEKAIRTQKDKTARAAGNPHP
jgi:tetratricopeptide (TPR) repeat protein